MIIPLPEKWNPPCNRECTRKYAAIRETPWRIYCKKGCDGDGDTWVECVGECDELCFKDPVFEGQQWSAVFDRSPGSAIYSEKCFRACLAGCAHKFDIPEEKINQVQSRAQMSPPVEKATPPPLPEEKSAPSPPPEDKPAPPPPPEVKLAPAPPPTTESTCEFDPFKDDVPNTSA
ncbi:hypothetical protein ABFS82_08G142600 [Erythranthe guttata]|uniref:Defensin-like protein n=1 Tax=Erythranthe guttata TaxID=4155 RepID=A0A022RSA6_ERYGU|nr:PREDICTED: chitin-binding lectin 1-like [Erythranthe guttata]EYU43397.1 hypothetical protein MIMGU_mgv1a018302mg [Erythranthe guttata]|eukprot:XP_012830513.1 PREDICTED: chitin-binding lectin 1-like [Erythranthe guttata]